MNTTASDSHAEKQPTTATVPRRENYEDVKRRVAEVQAKEVELEGHGADKIQGWVRIGPPWLLSMVAHAILLLVLASLTFTISESESTALLISATEQLDDDLFELEDIAIDQPFDVEVTHESFVPPLLELPEQELDVEIFEPPAPGSLSPDVPVVDMLARDDLRELLTSDVDVAGAHGLLGDDVPQTLRGRNPSTRMAMALRGGGSRASEAAVGRALEWFARHQFPDGSWSFDHQQCPQCRGQCGNPGGNKATTGATGMALLCYLGAGETHKTGKYKKVVEAGLAHLLNAQGADGSLAGGPIPAGDSASLMSHNSYCHGFAALALCEAYAMTYDKRLKEPGQAAIDWIVRLQDRQGGGFRYRPGQKGDVSVSTLQIMTLKSASQAGFVVPEETVVGAVKFLDSCDDRYGGQYGYSGPIHPWVPGSAYGGSQAIHSTTALGLLSRMYTGWPRDHPGMQRGAEHLASIGPAARDNYYNYYATLVLHHYGGREWKAWNAKMRDFLVARQSNAGHESGSWAPFGAFHMYGGRFMDTAFSCMTLEVYYRYLPIYKAHVR